MVHLFAFLHSYGLLLFIAAGFTVAVLAHEKNRKEREAKLERLARGEKA